VLPAEAAARKVDDAVRRDFPPSRTSPIYLAVDGASTNEIGAYAQRLARVRGVAAVAPPQRVSPGAWRVDVYPSADFLAAEKGGLVGRLRATPVDARVLAGGLAPWFHDQKASMRAHLPAALVVVAVATLLILFLMTGSVILPVKALLMNLLTVSVAFGAVVWIFQDGRLESVLDFESRGGLDFSQPILLFAVVFGLSTDYGVFLLMRIREEYLRTGDNEESVARGLERTGRIVTAAALLLCVAVGTFATGRLVFVKELGVGIAVGVLVDATIVRALLVPSLMKLLGDWNWWAPEPLRRIHRRLGLDH
ncbi:MAG TPA: MMPL family transporter, partial [Candidatus Limnocylindria bacterium]|nr:MMPL family transporter [Candidatus Limnocylindria bacterium]